VQVNVAWELGVSRARVEGHAIVRPLEVELLIVTLPEKLNRLVTTILTGILVWPLLKFTRGGIETLKSPTETDAVAELDVPPGAPTPLMVTA
jgi:hypothetical protein